MSSKLQITPSESGPRLRSWTAWWAIAKASAHRCKRDMACSEAGAKATVLELDAGIGAKATVLDCMEDDACRTWSMRR